MSDPVSVSDSVSDYLNDLISVSQEFDRVADDEDDDDRDQRDGRPNCFSLLFTQSENKDSFWNQNFSGSCLM